MPAASTTLPPDPASVPAARRFVETMLAQWGRDELIETVRLCVSELVTNVVIHANSAVQLEITDIGHRLRVDVEDASAQLPIAKRYAVDAATGRGLHLVEFLADAWGATPTEHGKRVWFEVAVTMVEPSSNRATPPVATASTASAHTARSAASGTDRGRAADDDSPLFTVQIRGLPVDLFRRTGAHMDELMRELMLIAGTTGPSAAPRRLLELGDEMRGRFSNFTAAPDAALAEAVATGRNDVDLDYELPAEAGEASQRLRDMLAEIDEFCRQEQLLTLATPPESAAFLRWFLDEFIGQIAGAAPKPWPGDETLPPAAVARGAEDWALALQAVTTSLVVTDIDGIIRRWSSNAESLFGYSRGEARGRDIGLVLSSDQAPDIREALQQVARWQLRMNRRRLRAKGGIEIEIVGFATRVVDDGEPALAIISLPASGTGGPDDEPSRATWARLRLLATERVAQLQAEDAVDVLQRVHEASTVLSEPLNLADVAAKATALAATVTGAISSTLYVVDDDRFVLAGCHGYDEQWQATYGALDADIDEPVATAVRHRQPVIVSTLEERLTRFPSTEPPPIERPSFAVLPLMVEGSAIGTLSFGFDHPRVFTPTDHRLLLGIADACAHAVGRAVQAEKSRRTSASLETLQRLTAHLARALRRDDIAATVLQLGTAEIGAASASLCIVTPDGQDLEIVAAIGYADAVASAWKRFPLAAELPASEAVRTGEPIFLSSKAETQERYPVFRTTPVIDEEAVAVIPLATEQGRVHGALVVAFADRRVFDTTDRWFLTALGAQCATALDRAILAEQVDHALAQSERDRALLETLLERAPVGLVFFDLDGRVVQTNDTFAQQVVGGPPDGQIGRTLAELLPDVGSDAAFDLADVLATGHAQTNREVASVLPGVGEVRHWLVSWYPVRDDLGKLFAVGAIFLDISDRKKAENDLTRLLAAERAARIATDAAARWLDRIETAPYEPDRAGETLDRVLAGLLIAVRDLYDADAAALLLADEAGTLGTRAAVGFESELDPVNIPLGVGFAGRVMASGRPVVVDELAEIEVASPMLRASGLHSMVAVPLMSNDHAYGVMHVGSRTPGQYSTADAERLSLIADRIAGAIERARLLASERKARASAEVAQDRLAFLADAGRIIGSSLDRNQILERVARLAASRIADDCAVRIVADDEVATVATHGTPPSADEIVDRVLRTGRTELAATADRLDIPVMVRGVADAVITMTTKRPRTFDAADAALSEELATRVATALVNAARYEREHGVAATLTRAVLPESLPPLPGLHVAARYRPAGPNVDVGGDWYDAFPLPDGRIGLVIGDVAGHGLEAAAGMVQVSNGLRAYAVDGRPPGEVLARTAAVLDMRGTDLIVTAIYAILDSATGELVWSSAGHPPPITVGMGRAEFLATTPGPVLGTGLDIPYSDQRATLERGRGLVLYTDGLVEQRDQDIDRGLDRLAEAARALDTLAPARVCATLLSALTGDADRDDDCCILCVHRL